MERRARGPGEHAVGGAAADESAATVPLASVAELVINSGDDSILGSHRREIVVVFCDLRGFTAFAESSEPEEVMGVLGEYHAALGELIFRYQGTWSASPAMG